MQSSSTKVDKDFIYELEQREEIGSSQISERLKKPTQTSSLSIAAFYPELNEQKTTHVNYIQSVPITSQIPFFSNKLLVKIEPFRTPEHFRAQYGVSVDEMVELIKRQLVIPVISSDLYRYIGLHYLAPIISIQPIIVSSVRNKHFFLTLSPNYEEYVKEGKELFKGRLLPFIKDWQKIYQTGAEAFITARAKRYARLKVLTPDIAEMVVQKVDEGPVLVDMLDQIFIDPYTTAIEGTYTIDEANYRRVVQAVPLLSTPKGFEVFHSQISQPILDYFGLSFPRVLTLNQLDNYQKSGLPERCNEILAELNDAVNSEPDNVENRAKKLIGHWRETTKYLDDMLRQKDNVDKIIAGGSIIIVGVGTAITTKRLDAGAFTADITLATNMLPFIQRIRSGFAETVAKLGKPRLACIMFDFKKAVDDLFHRQEGT